MNAPPMTSTYSMWSLFRNCRKACEYRYEIGLTAREKDPNLTFGSLIHECLQAWHRSRDLAAVLDFIDQACTTRVSDDGVRKDWHLARAMMTGYAARYPHEDFTVVALEKTFEGPIINPATGAASRSFVLAGKVDGIVRIAAMLTAVCRHIIRGPTPLALFDATSQGTGKTLLAEVIAMILTGRPAELMSAPGDPDEWRKQLTSILMEAPSLVIVDNVSSTMDWSVFCEVSTSETHKDRILGRTKTVTLSVRCSWIATGNNLQLAGDMARRCYWIRMDAGCSDPFRRTGFKHPRLKDYVLERRRELLLALLTLARSWFAAGQPRSSVPPVGSFEHWTEVISGILQYAGVEGFLANSERLFEQADVERSDWETFLEALEDAFTGAPFTVAELWERLNEKTYEELIRQSVLSDRAEALRGAVPIDLTRSMDREGQFKQRVGLGFNQRRGRRFGKRQLRIERDADDKHSKVARWRVVADD